MKSKLSLSPALMFFVMLLLSFGIVAADEKPQGRTVGGGEMGIEATVYDAGPLTSDQVKSADHMEYARGMVCVECHEVSFDLTTNATKQFTNNFPQLSNDEIWEKIVAFLPGRERFALTTSFNGEPTATTVDMVLDQEEQVLFVVSEKGTEKLLHIRRNPHVSAVRFHGWTLADGGKKEWRSTQIKATAEVIEDDDPRFDEFLEKYNVVRMTNERAHLRFDLIRVTPSQIYYFDTTLGADGLSVYQLWTRD